MKMSYKDRCRTCLGRNKEMKHIHSTISIAGDDVQLSAILLNFYKFKVSSESDSYPENVCIHCVNHLTLTYSFKTLIENSTQTLEDAANNVDTNDYDYDMETEYKPVRKKIRIHYPKSIPKRNIRQIKMNKTTRRLFCVECKAEFHTLTSLSKHCTNNHPVKSTTGRDCDFCSEKFEDFKDLVTHRKLHLKPYLCLICWTGFYNDDDLKNHICQPNQRDKGSKDKVLHQCDQCGKSYPSGYIKVHMMTHGNELRYSCKYCPKKFKVANGLNSHILWNHKRTRNHKCEVCNATFISASARSTHVRKNHLKEKKYCCESCSKRFFSKSELQRHTLTHTGVKNFHCHLCDKSYQTRYGLNVHLKSHAHDTPAVNDFNLKNVFSQ